MLKAMLRDLRAHPARVAMTLVAIVLGVTFVVATWVVSDSAAKTVANASTRSDMAVVVAGKGWDDRLTAADRDKLAALPGVTRANGVVIGSAAPVGKNGKLGTTYYAEFGGTSWDGTERFSLVNGRGPAGPGEIALEEEAAKEAGWATGDRIRVLLAEGKEDSALVTGVYTYRKATEEMAPVVAYEQATAVKLLGGKLLRVELFGGDENAIAASAKAAGFSTVETRADLKAAMERDGEETAQVVRNFLLAFAGVALFAGMFVIANTFTMLVAQRTRHFALLRAVGAKRRQVRRAVLGEALVLGFVGSTIGVGLGIAMGLGAMSLLRTTGETVMYAVSPTAVITGYLTGVVVTMLAAYGSARRGAAIAPIAALRTDAVVPRRNMVIRTVLGGLCVAAGVAIVLATSGSELSETERAMGMGGAMTALLGVLLLAPLLASAVLRPLSLLTRNRRGPLAGTAAGERLAASRQECGQSAFSPVTRLAVRNAIRDPRRTAATASALMIGLTLVAAFATVGITLRSWLTDSVEGTVPASAVIVQPAQGGSLDPSIAEQIRNLPEVRSQATLQYRMQQGDLPIAGVEADGIGKALTPIMNEGVADIRGGVLVDDEDAAYKKWKVGDTITLTIGGKSVSLPIRGIYENNNILQGTLVDEALLPPATASYLPQIAVVGDSGLKSALDKAFASRPDVVILDRQAVIDEVIKPMEIGLNIVYGLLGAAVIIAVFGVVNTLALSVLERTREIGVFRAVGATRKLVRRSVRRESLIIAAYGGVLGVGAGLLLGGVMQHVIITQPILSLSIPWDVVSIALGGMVVVGVLAALWPARRAARTDVLGAIATE